MMMKPIVSSSESQGSAVYFDILPDWLMDLFDAASGDMDFDNGEIVKEIGKAAVKKVVKQTLKLLTGGRSKKEAAPKNDKKPNSTKGRKQKKK